MTIPFSQALRERTWTPHGDTESETFMTALMKGTAEREDYVALVVEHFFMYEALEEAAEQLRDDAVAGTFVTDSLTRLPRIRRDLDFLLGEGWEASASPLPSTREYVDRIREASTWAGGFIAHHYTRYLGDLSGGQMILRRMRKFFGFEDAGVEFYIFPEIPDPAAFKDDYRLKLDALPFTDEEKDRLIDEVIHAYDLNAAVFRDLATAKAAV